MIKEIVVGIIALFILIGIGNWMDKNGWISGPATSPAPAISQTTSDLHQQAVDQANKACAALVAKTGGTCKTIATSP
jgi:hypothetical protein